MKSIPELSLETAGSINPPTSANRQSCLPSCMIKSADHIYISCHAHMRVCVLFGCLFLRKGLTVYFKLSWTHCDVQTGLVTMQCSCLSFLNAEITTGVTMPCLKDRSYYSCATFFALWLCLIRLSKVLQNPLWDLTYPNGGENGKMAHLPHKHQDLSSNPQNPQ